MGHQGKRMLGVTEWPLTRQAINGVAVPKDVELGLWFSVVG